MFALLRCKCVPQIVRRTELCLCKRAVNWKFANPWLPLVVASQLSSASHLNLIPFILLLLPQRNRFCLLFRRCRDVHREEGHSRWKAAGGSFPSEDCTTLLPSTHYKNSVYCSVSVWQTNSAWSRAYGIVRNDEKGRHCLPAWGNSFVHCPPIKSSPGNERSSSSPWLTSVLDALCQIRPDREVPLNKVDGGAIVALFERNAKMQKKGEVFSWGGVQSRQFAWKTPIHTSFLSLVLTQQPCPKKEG